VLWRAANLVSRACGPHLLYIAQCDRAHQPSRIGRPDRGARLKAQWAVGPTDEEITLTTGALRSSVTTYEHPAPPRSPAAASVRSVTPCSLGKLMKGQG
jgi:hypothetical protein